MTIPSRLLPTSSAASRRIVRCTTARSFRACAADVRTNCSDSLSSSFSCAKIFLMLLAAPDPVLLTEASDHRCVRFIQPLVVAADSIEKLPPFDAVGIALGLSSQSWNSRRPSLSSRSQRSSPVNMKSTAKPFDKAGAEDLAFVEQRQPLRHFGIVLQGQPPQRAARARRQSPAQRSTPPTQMTICLVSELKTTAAADWAIRAKRQQDRAHRQSVVWWMGNRVLRQDQRFHFCMRQEGSTRLTKVPPPVVHRAAEVFVPT